MRCLQKGSNIDKRKAKPDFVESKVKEKEIDKIEDSHFINVGKSILIKSNLSASGVQQYSMNWLKLIKSILRMLITQIENFSGTENKWDRVIECNPAIAWYKICCSKCKRDLDIRRLGISTQPILQTREGRSLVNQTIYGSS